MLSTGDTRDEVADQLARFVTADMGITANHDAAGATAEEISCLMKGAGLLREPSAACSMEDIIQKRTEELKETGEILTRIPGGSDVLRWLGGRPEFGDGEVTKLVLDRRGSSLLQIAIDHFGKQALITFELTDWIDADVRGFSHQNVVGGLKLRIVGGRATQPWDLGTGEKPGRHLIELEPCFGACGSIQATISSVTLVEV